MLRYSLRNLPLLVVLLILMSCQNNFELKEGDFLFQDMDCGPMCEAIEEVTQGINGAKLSHIGLVVFDDNTTKILEAISIGVVLTPLDEFINRSFDSDGNPKVLVGRFKKEKTHLIPKTKIILQKYIGAAYNHSFIWGNNDFYCSQLLYLIFKEANNDKEVFELAPMTFKPINSNNYFPVWENYYNDLGLEIPEGEPGCNPGGLSQSRHIEIVHAYGLPEGWK